MAATQHANRQGAEPGNIANDVLALCRRAPSGYRWRSHESARQGGVVSTVPILAKEPASVRRNESARPARHRRSWINTRCIAWIMGQRPRPRLLCALGATAVFTF